MPTVIRAGQTLPVSATEVNIRFRRGPYDIFGLGQFTANDALRFRIWPETAMGLSLIGKKPGEGWRPEVQELSFAQEPGSDMHPYDRLIGAALDGVSHRRSSPARDDHN